MALYLVLGALVILCVILALIAWDTGQLLKWWQAIQATVQDRQVDAILIGLAGAATFIGSAIFSIIRNPGDWHAQSFGIGFGSLASGLGVLFKLRQRRRDDDENH